ncbi:MAG TPA: outer membrane protein [Pseudolabrys sp.]|nr:outer membrane protein [Pseudolabrys sp.]
MMRLRRRVHRSAISIACATLLAGPALASDLALPVKAPQPLHPPAGHDWSGFYLGIHGGYGWDPAHATFDPRAFITDVAPLFTINSVSAPFDLSVSPEGWLGGLQAGYNWQNGAFVYGFETGLSWGRIKDESTAAFSAITDPNVNDGFGDAIAGQVRLKQELDYFGTLQGRAGLAVNSLLLYGTGGLSFGRVKTTFETFNMSTQTLASAPAAAPRSATSDKVRFGFTVGGGVEWAFAPAWSVKTEYLYVNLGKGDTLRIPGGIAHSEFHMHLVRAGLNYHFGAH